LKIDNIIPSVVIKEILFNDGNRLKFKSDDIVLLVGANNVGKSRTLKDLKDDLDCKSESKVLVKEISYKKMGFSESQLRDYFDRNYIKSSNGGYEVIIGENDRRHFADYVFANIGNGEIFFSALFSFLSTEDRLSLTRPIQLSILPDTKNLYIYQKLEKSYSYITKLNDALDSGFQNAIEVFEDNENGRITKKYKIGRTEDILKAIEYDSRKKIEELKKFEDLNDQGDGIRNAVAILASLIVNEHSLFLIDEPEAFLHPPQARILGKNIVQLSKNKQIFVSTHNIDFIKGALEGDSSRVKIIKIDRYGNENKFNLVDNKSISKISSDKNLKYTNLLDGLFYNQIVLCENESDCKFYSAILESIDLNIYQNTLFCAVGGKEQFKKIVPLLKALNIKYKIIADIDMISDIESLKQLTNSVTTDCYNEIRVKHKNFLDNFKKETNPKVKTQEEKKTEIIQQFSEDRYMPERVAKKIKLILRDESNLKILKNRGKQAIPEGQCVELFDQINDFLKKNNIFIVECGEIERFVPDVCGHGNTWVENTFTAYEDISASIYNDAKNFIRTVFNE
jgi:putative ATPase